MRAPINTAIWFLVWFLLVGWGLLYRSRQTDSITGKVDPSVLHDLQPKGQSQEKPQPKEDPPQPKDTPSRRGSVAEASASKEAAPKRSLPKVDVPPVGAIDLTQLVKLLSLHLWEGVKANEALEVYANETNARQKAVLAQRGLLADVNMRGLNKSRASGDAWARLSGEDSRFQIGNVLDSMAGFKRAFGAVGAGISLSGTPRDVANAVVERINQCLAMQRPIPGAVWLASMDLRDRFYSGRQNLEAVNADIDSVVDALRGAGASLGNAPLCLLFPPDLPVPPTPIPCDVSEDSQSSIVLVTRKYTADETTEMEYIYKPQTRPPTRASRVRELLEKNPAWGAAALSATRDGVRIGMVLGDNAFSRRAFYFSWTTSDPNRLRNELLTAAAANPHAFAIDSNIKEAGNRLLWNLAKDWSSYSNWNAEEGFRSFLKEAIAKAGLPFSLPASVQVREAPDGKPGLLPTKEGPGKDGQDNFKKADGTFDWDAFSKQASEKK